MFDAVRAAIIKVTGGDNCQLPVKNAVIKETSTASVVRKHSTYTDENITLVSAGRMPNAREIKASEKIDTKYNWQVDNKFECTACEQ